MKQGICNYHFSDSDLEEFAKDDEKNLEVGDYGDDISGERNLLIAIIERAFYDLRSIELKNRETAREWLLQEASPDDEFTFPWMCQYLGWNVELAMNKVRALVYDNMNVTFGGGGYFI